MIGRASVTPLPLELQARLATPAFRRQPRNMRLSAEHGRRALRSGRGAAAIWPVQQALEVYATAVAGVRSETV